MTAWLHYIGGISINYIVDMLNTLFQFKISIGGLTQGWLRLANLLKPEYEKIGEKAKNSPDHSGVDAQAGFMAKTLSAEPLRQGG